MRANGQAAYGQPAYFVPGAGGGQQGAPSPQGAASGSSGGGGGGGGAGHMYNPYAPPFMPQHLHANPHAQPLGVHGPPPHARYWGAQFHPPPLHPLQHLPPPPPPPHALQQQQQQQQYAPRPPPAHFNKHFNPYLPPIQQQLLHHPHVPHHQHPPEPQPAPVPELEPAHADPADEVSPLPHFVISRFKYSPLDAPAITFSPLSRPPQDVIDRASKDFPPALRPSPRPRRAPRFPSPQPFAVPDDDQQLSNPSVSRPASPTATAPGADASVADTTPATSVAADALTPHSPISTSTSLSISPKAATGTPSASHVSLPTPADLAEPAKVPESPISPSTPAASAAPPPPAERQPAPAPAPAAKPSTVKKSWADLLRPGTGSGAGALPTSSVVGVSVSAEVERASGIFASPAKRAAVHSLVQLLSSPIPPSPGLPALRPRGLINGGNLCFANTILQALIYTPPFHRLFAELGKIAASIAAAPSTSTGPAQVLPAAQKHRAVLGQRLGGPVTPLVDATITFLDEFTPAQPTGDSHATGKPSERARSPTAGLDADAFIPTYIYDALKEKKRFDSMRRGHQEDAEEFLGFYLDTLEEELLALLGELSPTASGNATKGGKSEIVVEETSSDAGLEEDGWTEVGKRNRAVVVTSFKSTESPISRIFGGKLRSTVRTPGTGKDSVTIQDWNKLQLDIQPPHVLTVQDALKHLTAPETVQVGPSSATDASKQELLDFLPSVLALHIKRFNYDPTLPGGGGVVKNGKHVRFEPILEFSNELLAPSRRSTQPPKYRLFAIIYHHGQSATGGHYTLDVLHPVPGHQHEPWLRMDDDLVHRVQPMDVFGQDGRDDKVAYLLLYRPLR